MVLFLLKLAIFQYVLEIECLGDGLTRIRTLWNLLIRIQMFRKNSKFLIRIRTFWNILMPVRMFRKYSNVNSNALERFQVFCPSGDSVHFTNRGKIFVYLQSTYHLYKDNFLTRKRVVSGTRTYRTPLNIYWAIQRDEVRDISSSIVKTGVCIKPVIVAFWNTANKNRTFSGCCQFQHDAVRNIVNELLIHSMCAEILFNNAQPCWLAILFVSALFLLLILTI